MNSFFLLCFVVSLLALAACSTTQTKLMSARSVPEERLTFPNQKNENNNAEITIVRDQGLAASGCYYAVFIDNVLAARMDVAEKATFYTAPGNRKLKITRDPGGFLLCRVGSDAVEKEIAVKNNDSQSYRLSLDFSGQPDIQVYQESGM